MKTHLRRVLFLIAAIGLVAVAFSGCQTSDGLGRDIENLGENIQR